jgi:hypothetical protein
MVLGLGVYLIGPFEPNARIRRSPARLITSSRLKLAARRPRR